MSVIHVPGGTVGLPANGPSPASAKGPAIALPLITSLLEPIREWCGSHADRVSECHVIFRSEEVQLYMVGRKDPYDFQLGRQLSDLSGELIRAGWPMLTMLVPPSTPEELTAYVDPTKAVLVFRA